MGVRYFHDMPVYRLRSDAYYAARDAYVEKSLYPPGTGTEKAMRIMALTTPDSLAAWKGSLQRSYGGGWEFNEIIGYIRLHILGTQVRGEYFATAKKRIVRSRRKTFEYITWKLVPETFIQRPYGQQEILTAVREHVEDCRRALPRRYIDSSVLDFIEPHVDWPALLKAGNA